MGRNRVMGRHVCYVTGTRADFGLMDATLRTIHAHADLSLTVCATGMHLSHRYGSTIGEVEASGLPMLDPVKADMDTDTGHAAALATGDILKGFADRFLQAQPDIVLVLGDRLEMLSATLAAVCQNIPVAHMHGGERSGTIDESVRHAISKLAHLHLVATAGAKDRLIRMGEAEASIELVGAPGLVGIERLASGTRTTLANRYGLDADKPILLVLFHPVVQDASAAGKQVNSLLAGVEGSKAQALFLLPNADTGNSVIREAIVEKSSTIQHFHCVQHISRGEYVSAMKHADVLVGNSSSGIIEAGSFGTPVVNIGDRQKARERNSNITDVSVDAAAIQRAIMSAISNGRSAANNIYAQPYTDTRIAEALARLDISVDLLKKLNTY